MSEERLPGALVEASSDPFYGPNTVEEAKAFHEGFKAGAAAYAKQVKHDADPRINCILADLITESGWRCIEQFEKITGRTV